MMIQEADAYLRMLLLEAEELRLFPYQDTSGKLTIGVGRNLTDSGISREEAFYLLENDIRRATQQAKDAFPWFEAQDPVRRAALVELIFNMGLGNQKHGVRSFRNTLANWARGNYPAVAQGLRQSKWYTQVKPRRAERIIQMVLSGEWPDGILS